MKSREDAKKRALIVGINKYKDPTNNLRGCVPDALHMRKLLLEKFQFNADHIRMLLDERATYDNILIRLDWLIKQSKPGDTIVFHYSGHGSQIRDWDGDELNDHLDELICPHDMDWNKPLSDDILKKKFSKLLPRVNMYLIFDCCHSGTVDRSNHPEGESYRKARFLAPPLDIMLRSDNRDLKKVKIGTTKHVHWISKIFHKLLDKCKKSDKLLRPKVRPYHVTISGCRDNQTSADAYINGAYAGALSWYLINTLFQHPDITINEVYKKTKKIISDKGFSQDIQFYAPFYLANKPFCSQPD